MHEFQPLERHRPHAARLVRCDAGHAPHGTVLAELSYEGGTELIADAREAVAAAVVAHLSADAVEDARLVTSELVSNCHRHGSGVVRIRVVRDAGRVTVAVTDPHAVGRGKVRLREPGVEGPGGYGMHLVEAFTAGWDQVSDGSGTTVRFWMPVAADRHALSEG